MSNVLLLVFLFKIITYVNTQIIGTYQVTKRNYPFVDPSRCRHPDFCGRSPEWDLKFGRVL